MFWHKTRNFGDNLGPALVKGLLGCDIEFAGQNEEMKLIAVGSIMFAMRYGDVIWGTGLIEPKKMKAPGGVKFLSVRGPLTRELIEGDMPEVYGDSALALPEIYRPEVEKKYEIGYVPHYVHRGKITPVDGPVIDVLMPWQEVVKAIMSCKKIASSSLHGIIVAEAYGIPACWADWGGGVIGGKFKFHDYLLGTGRKQDDIGGFLPPIEGLEERRKKIIEILRGHYGKKD